MKPQQLASKLTVWSKRKFSYETSLQHANAFMSGTLGDGLIKDYFNTLCPPSLIACTIPTCTNTTSEKYCTACMNLSASSAAVKLLADLGTFLSSRK